MGRVRVAGLRLRWLALSTALVRLCTTWWWKTMSVGSKFVSSISGFDGQGASPSMISDDLRGSIDGSSRGAAHARSDLAACQDTSATYGCMPAKVGGGWTAFYSSTGRAWIRARSFGGTVQLASTALARAWPLVLVGSSVPPGSTCASCQMLPKLLLAYLGGCDAVCPHCSDTIAGCDGTGGNCPLVTDVSANAGMFIARTLGAIPRVSNAMTPELSSAFSRPVCEALVGIACAPPLGQSVDLATDTAYATSQAVVQAASYGHCSVSEAAAELSRRLEAATEVLEVNKIKGALDGLRIVTDSAIQSTQGVLMFVWSKVSNVVMKRGDGVTRLTTAGGQSSGGSRTSALTVTLSRPSQWHEFFEMLHFFVLAIVALGLANASVVLKLVDDVVWGTLRATKDTWETVCELFMLYLEEIDRDPTRTVSMSNVFRRGGQDSLLVEARRKAAAFFRTRAGTAQPSGTTAGQASAKPNGQFNKTTDKACVDYNMGRPCKRIDATGKCLFNHICNQFVSDKGAWGVCGRAHARHSGCDYDTTKKLSKPATQ